MVVWGSNMAEAFPVTFDRVRARLKANIRSAIHTARPCILKCFSRTKHPAFATVA